MAVQLVTRVWSALSKSVSLEYSGIFDCHYFIYNGRTVLRHVKMSRTNGFSPVSQLKSLDGVRHSLKAEEDGRKAEWERSLAVDYGPRLLTSQFFSRLLPLLGNNILCTLDS